MVAKKTSAKKTPAKKAPAKKTAAKKTPAKKTPAKKAPAKKTAGKAIRGRALAELVIAHLRGPKSPIGEPRPLSADERAQCEKAMGVALSPFMDAVFSFDVGWLAREVGLFDDHGAAQVAPCLEVIGEHADHFTEFYEPWCAARLDGKAARLDAGSDSMRFLYLGAPDEHGEYPVLGIDHDDLPLLAVEHAGFDVWMAESLGITVPGAAKLTKEASKRILGQPEAWEMGPEEYPDFDALPALTAAPAPGSVKHAPLVIEAPAAGKQRKLTVVQIAKALKENARAGRVERLAELIAESRARGMERRALDEALVEACLGQQGAAIRALLAAGASPNARDYYGGALTRLITYGGDVELVRLLLDAGASPDSPGVNGETAIFEAVERGDEAITRLLIERGADVNHLAKNELTPLHEAVCEQPDPRFVDILCEAGARADVGEQQSPVLVWAAERASLEHVRRLLAHGAPPNRRAAYLKQTALHAAFAYGRDDVAALLVRAGADRSLVDERGLSFERIYGPDGDDARPVSIRYAPSAEPQTIRIAVDVAVTNPYQAQNAWFPALTAAQWVRLVETGIAGEDAFAPETSRAEVVEETDRSGLGKGAFHRLSLAVRVSGVSAGFVRWMCLSLLGGTRVLTGAGAESVLRVVSLDLEGSHPGAETMDARALRAWAETSLTPRVWPEPLPFTLELRTATEPELVVQTQKAVSKPEDLFGPLQVALQAWTDLLARIPRRPDAPPFALVPMLRSPEPNAARFTLMNAFSQKKGDPLNLPWPADAVAAQLGQALRALHARVPLSRVQLSLPHA